MGTRGFVGIRNNKELISGRFNRWDSYYDSLGGEALDFYFRIKGRVITDLASDKEDDIEFLQNGLFCEYAYVYNKENDTLEIYRGFFENKQGGGIKNKILDSLEDKEKNYCHLVMIIDKKKHTKEKVLKAFEEYNDSEEHDTRDYPERDIIHLELNDDYVFLV